MPGGGGQVEQRDLLLRGRHGVQGEFVREGEEPVAQEPDRRPLLLEDPVQAVPDKFPVDLLQPRPVVREEKLEQVVDPVVRESEKEILQGPAGRLVVGGRQGVDRLFEELHAGPPGRGGPRRPGVAFLSRRPAPAAAEAVREAVIAVAAVVRTLAGGAGEVAMGTAEPAALRLGIPPGLREGIEAMLGYCHSASGLPGSDSPADLPDLAEATCLVVFCSSVISLLLSREREKARE